ncbi:hypothetical protein [uncultured Mediterranean phage uvDeep-CGR2-KM21-C338]|nr:hypothetical protein [uncultured Mediterranean phage uvDeep-CGR2-KM21-C338]
MRERYVIAAELASASLLVGTLAYALGVVVTSLLVLAVGLVAVAQTIRTR